MTSLEPLVFELKNKRGQAFRPYQHMIVDEIVKTPKCAIWSFMGSGKTAATLTAIDRLLLSGIEEKPVLVIAPLRVARDVWTGEIHEWAHLEHLRVAPIIGSKQERLDTLRRQADIYTVNFENLTWLINTWGASWPYGMIVVDESTKLKSLRANIRTNADGTSWVQGQGGERAKALLKATFEHKTTRFVELTGTPTPNGYQDLWGQYFFLDHGKRLGRVFEGFKQRWFKSSFDGFGMEPLEHAPDQIKAAVQDITMSLKSEDWFDLKTPIVREIKIELPPEARKQYREMEKQLFTEIQGTPVEAFNAGARTMKCLQMASGACYVGDPLAPGPRKWVVAHDEKLDALEDIVEETAGACLLVGYSFKSDLERILKRFPKAVHFSQEKGIMERWNKGQIPMLVAHPASVGHGLSLQHGGSILVRFSSDWNGEQFDQMLERIGPVRQAQSGYERNVFEYRIIANRTVDEDVYVSHATKRSVQDCLIDGMRRRLS